MTVSLVVIARNEASRIADCIASVRSLVNETVVVDTGSTDATREIACSHGAIVCDFPWCDDFAAARNEALRHATQPWVLSMDADDVVDEPNRTKLAALFASLGDENLGYMMQCASVGAAGGVTSSVGHVRLFRNDPRIRWDHRVHEQIATAIEESGGCIRSTDIVIHHHGYVDPEVLKRKLERNMRLLQLEASERPLDPVTQFNLGWALANLGRRDEAIVALNLSGIGVGEGMLHRKREGLLARCYYRTGLRTEAMQVVRSARGLYPDDIELLYTDAQLRTGFGDLPGAEACVREVIAAGRESTADCMDCSVFGSAGFYLLGLVCALQAKHAEAEEAAREATLLDPSLLAAWVVLADALAEQGKLGEIEGFATDPRAPETIRLLLQVCALALRGDTAEAMRKLSPFTPDESSLLAHARLWVAHASAHGSRRSRILDLMRVG